MKPSSISNNEILDFNIAYELDGHKVVFIEDEVSSVGHGDDESFSNHVKIDTCSFEHGGEVVDVQIFANEDELQKARDSHPDASVFGFWQVVLSNSLLSYVRGDVSERAYVYEISPGCGMYITFNQEEGVLGGSYSGGVIPGLFGVNPDSLPSVSVDVRTLQLPENEAKLPEEILAESKEAKRANVLKLLVVAGVIGTAAVGSDVFLSYLFEQKREEVRLLQTDLKAAKDMANSLRRSRIDSIPDQRQALSRIRSIVKSINVSFGTGVSLGSREATNVSVNDQQVIMLVSGNSDVPDGLKSQRLQNGDTLIVVPLNERGEK